MTWDKLGNLITVGCKVQAGNIFTIVTRISEAATDDLVWGKWFAQEFDKVKYISEYEHWMPSRSVVVVTPRIEVDVTNLWE